MTTVAEKPTTAVEVKPFMVKFHQPVPTDSEVNQISAGCKFATTYTAGGDTAGDYKCDF